MALPHQQPAHTPDALLRQLRHDLELIAQQRGNTPIGQAHNRVNTILFKLMSMAEGHEEVQTMLSEISTLIRNGFIPATDDALRLAADAQAESNRMFDTLDELSRRLHQIEQNHKQLESALRSGDEMNPIVYQLIERGRERERDLLDEINDPVDDLAAMLTSWLPVDEADAHDFCELLAWRGANLPLEAQEQLAQLITQFANWRD